MRKNSDSTLGRTISREILFAHIDARTDSEYAPENDCEPLGFGVFEHRWNKKPYICNFPDVVSEDYFLMEELHVQLKLGQAMRYLAGLDEILK